MGRARETFSSGHDPKQVVCVGIFDQHVNNVALLQCIRHIAQEDVAVDFRRDEGNRAVTE